MEQKNLDIKFEGALVRLVEVPRYGDEYYIRFAGDGNSPVFKDYERMQNIAKLIDSNGKEFRTQRRELRRRAQQHVRVRRELQRLGDERAEGAAGDAADGDQGNPRTV